MEYKLSSSSGPLQIDSKTQTVTLGIINDVDVTKAVRELNTPDAENRRQTLLKSFCFGKTHQQIRGGESVTINGCTFSFQELGILKKEKEFKSKQSGDNSSSLVQEVSSKTFSNLQDEIKKTSSSGWHRSDLVSSWLKKNPLLLTTTHISTLLREIPTDSYRVDVFPAIWLCSSRNIEVLILFLGEIISGSSQIDLLKQAVKVFTVAITEVPCLVSRIEKRYQTDAIKVFKISKLSFEECSAILKSVNPSEQVDVFKLLVPYLDVTTDLACFQEWGKTISIEEYNKILTKLAELFPKVLAIQDMKSNALREEKKARQENEGILFFHKHNGESVRVNLNAIPYNEKRRVLVDDQTVVISRTYGGIALSGDKVSWSTAPYFRLTSLQQNYHGNITKTSGGEFSVHKSAVHTSEAQQVEEHGYLGQKECVDDSIPLYQDIIQQPPITLVYRTQMLTALQKKLEELQKKEPREEMLIDKIQKKLAELHQSS